MIIKDIVLTSLDEVIDNLVRDEDVSQELLDTLIYACEEIEYRGNNFVLIREEQGLGYILDEFENMEDEPIETTTYWFEDYD
jgi:hypothetical protein